MSNTGVEISFAGVFQVSILHDRNHKKNIGENWKNCEEYLTENKNLILTGAIRKKFYCDK